jgi:hypothetical protein
MQPNDTIPFGYCQCGCGQKTRIANRSLPEFGIVKGQPRKYLRDHRGIKHTPEYIEDPSTGCWEWQRALNKTGYGVAPHQRGKRGGRLAHRVVYERLVGPIPVGMCLCHKCDNPRCVNPSHMFIGTHADNMRDAANKGRIRVPALSGDDHPFRQHPEYVPRGEDHAHKLTEDQVREIRQRAANGEPLKALAVVFNVSAPTISAAVRRRNWKHVI